MMIREIVLVAVYTLLLYANLFGQSITIDPNAIGFILVDGKEMGTGFVLSKPNQVVTCAHVIDTSKKLSFFSLKSALPFELRIFKYDNERDIALLVSDSDISAKPLKPSRKFKVIPEQHLFYIGFNPQTSSSRNLTLQANQALVSAVGKVNSGSKIVDFIEFVGVGIPGYSGGPVFDDDGQVVGIMREAWLKQGLKASTPQLINRAFSIQSLKNK